MEADPAGEALEVSIVSFTASGAAVAGLGEHGDASSLSRSMCDRVYFCVVISWVNGLLYATLLAAFSCRRRLTRRGEGSADGEGGVADEVGMAFDADGPAVIRGELRRMLCSDRGCV